MCEAASDRCGAPVLPAIPLGASYGHGTGAAGHGVADPRAARRDRAAVRGVGGDVRACAGCCSSTRTSATPRRSASRPTTSACSGPTCGSASSSGGRSTRSSPRRRWPTATTSTRTGPRRRSMLAVAPELVDRDAMAGADDPDRTGDLVFRYTAPSLSTNGVTGRPSEATAELGELLVARTADALAERVERGRRRGAAARRRPVPHAHRPPRHPRRARRCRQQPPGGTDGHRRRRSTEDQRTLADDLAAQGVEYVFGAYVDIIGRSKSKVVPVEHLPNLLAGSERYTPRGLGDLGQMTPHEDECVAMPDPVDAADHAVGPPLRVDGRGPALRRDRAVRALHPIDAEAASSTRGRGPRVRVQPRRRDRDLRVQARRDRAPTATSSRWRRAGRSSRRRRTTSRARWTRWPFLDPMVRAMNETGFGVFSFDHEGGDAQFEFDFDVRARAGDGRQDHVLPADGEADRQAGRARGHVHAEAVHDRRGARVTTST